MCYKCMRSSVLSFHQDAVSTLEHTSDMVFHLEKPPAMQQKHKQYVYCMLIVSMLMIHQYQPEHIPMSPGLGELGLTKSDIVLN